MTHIQKNKHTILLVLIIALAIFARVLNIDTAPSGLYPDEANNATNAYDAQATGDYQWFYPDNNGREGMYINLMALSFKFFGVSPLTLKLPSIFFGVMAVLGVYFLSRELFRSNPRIALIAAYLMSVSFWAINFSRIGFRAIAMLPILAFTFYFLFRGIRTKRFYNYIVAGAVFGLGFHTYIAFRVVPVLLVILLVLFLLIDKNFLKYYWKAILAFIATALIVVAPLALTFVAHPEYLSARTGDVSIFSESNPDSLPVSLVKTIGLSLGQFNVYGDPNWRHNFPPHALLEPLTGLAFLTGLILSIGAFFHFLRLRITTNVRNRMLVVHGLLLAWFVGLLAPSFLTIEGMPHALRSIGVLPVVYILAAWSLHTFFVYLKDRHATFFEMFGMGLMITFFAYVGIFNMSKYHLVWAQKPQVAEAFHKPLTDIATQLHFSPSFDEKVVIAGPLERLPIDIYTKDLTDVSFLYLDQRDLITLDNQTLYMTHYDEDLIAYLEERFADDDLLIEEHRRSLESIFYTARKAHPGE